MTMYVSRSPLSHHQHQNDTTMFVLLENGKQRVSSSKATTSWPSHPP